MDKTLIGCGYCKTLVEPKDLPAHVTDCCVRLDAQVALLGKDAAECIVTMGKTIKKCNSRYAELQAKYAELGKRAEDAVEREREQMASTVVIVAQKYGLSVEIQNALMIATTPLREDIRKKGTEYPDCDGSGYAVRPTPNDPKKHGSPCGLCGGLGWRGTESKPENLCRRCSQQMYSETASECCNDCLMFLSDQVKQSQRGR